MDALVREKIRTALGFRFVAVDDYRSALRLESMIKGGRLKRWGSRTSTLPRSGSSSRGAAMGSVARDLAHAC